MKLTELLYPFAFLPVCLLLYYVLPKRCRNAALLAASLLFFAWGTPEYLVLLALAILLNYFAGLELESLLEDGKTGHARLVLVLTILADLLPLLFFKYYGEAAAALNRVFVLSLPVHALPAPVGVLYVHAALGTLGRVSRAGTDGEEPHPLRPVRLVFPEADLRADRAVRRHAAAAGAA